MLKRNNKPFQNLLYLIQSLLDTHANITIFDKGVHIETYNDFYKCTEHYSAQEILPSEVFDLLKKEKEKRNEQNVVFDYDSDCESNITPSECSVYP
jgi:hypothetical protein